MKLIQDINLFCCKLLFGKKQLAPLLTKETKKSDALSSFLKGGINELKTEVAKHTPKISKHKHS